MDGRDDEIDGAVAQISFCLDGNDERAYILLCCFIGAFIQLLITVFQKRINVSPVGDKSVFCSFAEGEDLVHFPDNGINGLLVLDCHSDLLIM